MVSCGAGDQIELRQGINNQLTVFWLKLERFYPVLYIISVLVCSHSGRNTKMFSNDQ